MTYAMANIKLPILIKQDRSIEPLTEYISIQIGQCDLLPEKTDERLIKKSLLEQINESIDRLKYKDVNKDKDVSEVLLDKDKDKDVSEVLVKDKDKNVSEFLHLDKDKDKNVSDVLDKDKESLRISLNDLLTRPPRVRHNTSFKNKPNRVKRRSAKQYSQ